jgi:hypothetical protein
VVRGEEQAEAGLATGPVDVDRVHVPQVGRFDQHADLLLRFPGGGVEHGLTRVELPGRQVPAPVEGRVGITPLGEQHVVAVEKHHVNVHQVPVGHWETHLRNLTRVD